jgi:hypothetical protein
MHLVGLSVDAGGKSMLLCELAFRKSTTLLAQGRILLVLGQRKRTEKVAGRSGSVAPLMRRPGRHPSG